MLNHKGSADRVRSAQQVLAVIAVQGDALKAGLRDALGVDAQVDPLLTAIQATLRDTADALQAASAAHEAELNDDHDVRADRDAQVEAVYAALMRTRLAIASAYGRDVLKGLGLDGRVNQRPDRLITAAQTLVAKAGPHLADRPTLAGLVIDLPALLGPVEAALPRLIAAVEAVEREAREAAVTQSARDAAMDAHDATFSKTAGALSALFTLAGKPDLARKVRPSRRRVGRVAEPTDPAEAPEGETDDLIEG